MNPAGALHGLSWPQSHRDVVPAPVTRPRPVRGRTGRLRARCGPLRATGGVEPHGRPPSAPNLLDAIADFAKRTGATITISYPGDKR